MGIMKRVAEDEHGYAIYEDENGIRFGEPRLIDIHFDWDKVEKEIETMKFGDKKPLKEDIDQFFRVAMSALCHCYDNTKGFYPDKCDCDKREKVHEAMSALIEEHKRIVRKWNL